MCRMGVPHASTLSSVDPVRCREVGQDGTTAMLQAACRVARGVWAVPVADSTVHQTGGV